MVGRDDFDNTSDDGLAVLQVRLVGNLWSQVQARDKRGTVTEDVQRAETFSETYLRPDI